MADQGNQTPPPAGKTKIGSILAWVIAPPMVIIAHATLTVLLIGMIPTFVAFLIDRHPMKYTTRTVGYMNFCGVLPYAVQLWRGANDFEAALQLVSDPLGWLIMLSSAGAGWAIVFMVPPIVSAYLSVTSEIKEKTFKDRQKDLVDEWGASVRQEALGGGPVEDDSDDENEGDQQPDSQVVT
jgi:hypothetical protein